MGFLGHLIGQRMAILKYFMVNGDNLTRVFHVNISGGGVSSGPGRGYRRLVPDQFISNLTKRLGSEQSESIHSLSLLEPE